MDKIVHSALSDLGSKLNALLSSLTTSPTAVGAPAAALSLLEADDALTSAVETLRVHQANYAKILKLRLEAERLEQRVKGIVRDIESFDKDIRTTCHEDGDDSDGSDSNSDSEAETKKEKKKNQKEVDYKLLLDFARRISKYNHEAAADAAAGVPPKKLPPAGHQDQDVDMTGTNGVEGGEPVSSVTKSATRWLDDSANQTREVYMLPYPTEERIRMGMMGQIQAAAAEGRPGFDPETEVERLIRESEGLEVAAATTTTTTTTTTAAGPAVGEENQVQHAAEAAKAAESVSSLPAPPGATRGPVPVRVQAAPAPKPKATLDLDLYDPEDDDF
ncbi:hypothetical protein ASPZODRAFT_1499523 [Penicilliopsis zonata CBS 506.65]|uniref:Mediator of RNA polymerase II transcription subunit 4 n=1 Tax=Penicilliopsis zonata CBS 506.65 TaxID=1073090 RepID=A0A1L9SQW2_9EURO|nr:hypothetical protein ASPZODRAFT_1499523 [Penicilliopsis zonata CBS 506.65]OJJ49493.1 hypothetical protein ASPZODRAFT_1499523 [Penicilliopsis zonata CBS 506.65]